MADEAGAEQAEGDGELSFVDWTCTLLSLERVTADPEDEDCTDIFTAKFQVDGPNANAEVEVIVSDFTDEANVIAIAQHTLHVATTMWGRITADRWISARASDLPKPAEARGGRKKGAEPGT